MIITGHHTLLGDNVVLGFDQTAWIVLSRYVTEPDIARECVEERNSVSNKYRYSSDNKALNEADALIEKVPGCVYQRTG